MVAMSPNHTQRNNAARQKCGFTLIEMMVVLAVLALLLTIVTPRYFVHIQRSKEAVLKQNLHSLRDVIDKYHGDHGKYPEKLADLVTQRYIREVPIDPLTESAATWIIIAPDSGTGVYDLHSGAQGKDERGIAYQQW